jgi:H+/Cl- antiporter ClcA
MFILEKYRSIFRTLLKLLPLFTGATCTLLLLLALVPGRLEYYLDTYVNDDSYLFWIGILGSIPFFLGLFGLTIYETIQLLLRKQSLRQAFGTFGLTIALLTKLALSFELPARLYFYTHTDQLEKALARHISSGNRKNFYFQTRNFAPKNSPNGVEEQYGFAYLPHPSKTY